MNREPTPASVSSSGTPSGVSIVSRSSNTISDEARHIHRCAKPGLARARAARCARRAGGRSGSDRTGSCGSAPSTAPRPPTSRDSAAHAPRSPETARLEVARRRSTPGGVRRPHRAALGRPLLRHRLLAARSSSGRRRCWWRSCSSSARQRSQLSGAIHDPAAATGVVPQQFRPALQPGHPWHDMSPSQQTAFTTEVFTNNIQVTLVAFAGGITGGIATALALLYNGLQLGVIGGLMGQAGNGVGFVDLVTAHGVLELSCILVGGAAGLSLGWSMISPGLRTRRASLQREAREALLLVARDGAVARGRRDRRGEPRQPGRVRARRRDRHRRRARRRLLGARRSGAGRRPTGEPATSPADTS